MRRLTGSLGLILLAACGNNSTVSGPSAPLVGAPTGLSYYVGPVGSGTAPSSILLRWDFDTSSALAVWNVYSRRDTTAGFFLRAETTSPTFHDAGIPDVQYLVTAVDVNGNESSASPVVTVDERLQLVAPESLYTTALNGGVALDWPDNAYAPDFLNYRVYSASYDLGSQLCGTDWGLEGTTISPDFIATLLPNGQPRCFAVSAVDTLGYESLWSPIQAETPRFDARDVVVNAVQFSDTGSAFRFWQDLNSDGLATANELGLLYDGSNLAADFSVTRDGSNNLFLTPVRSGTEVQSVGPVTDVNDIHYAPASGYDTTSVQATPGTGYIFQMNGGDGFLRYGAVRVSHVGTDFLILDWAYQSDPGSPMLVGQPAAASAPTPQPRPLRSKQLLR
ncbi:MAG TPA: hypothetical protein VFI39_07965 [Gemmatimonadales bacterium]|nr:hypothetical protein [Gemmatimonadales bacterium]